jgi:hypothetical protein
MTPDNKIFDTIAKLLEGEPLPRVFGLYVVGNYVAVHNGHQIYTLPSRNLFHCLLEIGLEDGGTVLLDLEKRTATLMDMPAFMGQIRTLEISSDRTEAPRTYWTSSVTFRPF